MKCCWCTTTAYTASTPLPAGRQLRLAPDRGFFSDVLAVSSDGRSVALRGAVPPETMVRFASLTSGQGTTVFVPEDATSLEASRSDAMTTSRARPLGLRLLVNGLIAVAVVLGGVGYGAAATSSVVEPPRRRHC